MRSLLFALALFLGCAASAGSVNAQSTHVSVRVVNNTPFDLVLYVTPSGARVGRVTALTSACIRLRLLGSGRHMALAGRVFGGSGISVHSPGFSFQTEPGWRWTIQTVTHGNALSLEPEKPCGVKET